MSVDNRDVATSVDAIMQNSMMNPYDDDLKYDGLYHCTKMIVLFPIVIVRILWFLFTILVAYIFSLIASEAQMRRYFTFPAKLMMYSFGYYHVKVKNRHFLGEIIKQRGLVVFNHVSMFDGILLCGYVHPFAIALNSVHGSMGFFTHISRKLQYVLIDYKRGGGQTAKLIDHLARPGSNVIAIAPEGTTHAGRAVLRFRTGAFAPLRPVLPILIRCAQIVLLAMRASSLRLYRIIS